MQEHAKKHKKIVDRLVTNGLNKQMIIEYFDFENMKEKERNFCPLYAQNKKCHDMQKLNCYLCACPNFRFSDAGIKRVDKKMQYSYCNIKSKDGRLGVYGDKIHQDCSHCTIPHTQEYISQHFDLNWTKIMKKTEV